MMPKTAAYAANEKPSEAKQRHIAMAKVPNRKRVMNSCARVLVGASLYVRSEWTVREVRVCVMTPRWIHSLSTASRSSTSIVHPHQGAVSGEIIWL